MTIFPMILVVWSCQVHLVQLHHLSNLSCDLPRYVDNRKQKIRVPLYNLDYLYFCSFMKESDPMTVKIVGKCLLLSLFLIIFILAHLLLLTQFVDFLNLEFFLYA